MTLLCIGVFASSLTCSLVLTPYVRHVCKSHSWLVAPDADRHLHNTPLPRLGGIAIFAAFLVGNTFILLNAWLHSQSSFEISSKAPFTILFAGSMIFLLGFYDDLYRVGAYSKFAVQALAAVILFWGGIQVRNLPVLFGHHQLPWFISLAFGILWVLAITNAFNLIDGVDGLAAGSALSSSVILFIAALLNQNASVSLMTLALSGAILGFLRYNFNPATIFLGDSGSLFIGFMLSALALEGAQKARPIVAVAIPVSPPLRRAVLTP